MKKSSLEELRHHLRALSPEFYDLAVNQNLDPSKVPCSLQRYMPYAELWGISDDLMREQLASTAPQSIKDDLRAVIRSIDDELDKWLAGPEASSKTPSREYVAFSA